MTPETILKKGKKVEYSAGSSKNGRMKMIQPGLGSPENAETAILIHTRQYTPSSFT